MRKILLALLGAWLLRNFLGRQRRASAAERLEDNP
jgi:hypothetical protein